MSGRGGEDDLWGLRPHMRVSAHLWWILAAPPLACDIVTCAPGWQWSGQTSDTSPGYYLILFPTLEISRAAACRSNYSNPNWSINLINIYICNSVSHYFYYYDFEYNFYQCSILMYFSDCLTICSFFITRWFEKSFCLLQTRFYSICNSIEFPDHPTIKRPNLL